MQISHNSVNFRVTWVTATILILCLSTRLFLFFIAQPWTSQNENDIIIQFDAVGYNRLANNLLYYGEFSQEVGGEPEALRTPVYPLFISLFYAVFGQRVWIILVIQIFLDVVSCLLMMFVFTEALSLKVASSAGLFYALDPHLILYANHLLSETLFVFFCMVFFFFMVKAISKKPTNKKMWFAILAGLWLGMATLVKPISQFLPVIIVCFFAFAPTQIKKGLKLSGVFILVFVLVTFPWLLRNYLTFDVLSISSSSDYNLLLLHVASFETDRRGVQDKQIAQTILRNEANEMMRADGLDPNSMHPYGFVPTSYYRQLAMQYIKQYPACFAKHYIAGLLHLFLELDTPNYARYLHIPITTFHTKGHANIFELMIEWFRQKTTAEMSIGIFVITYLVICYVAVAVGIFTSIKNKDYHCIFLLLCAVIAAYFILLTGTAGFARFRVPAIPFYLSFAGIGVVSIQSFAGKFNPRNFLRSGNYKFFWVRFKSVKINITSSVRKQEMS